MKKGAHISEVSAARFEAAVRESLRTFETGGDPFNVSDVIRGAKYADGALVGPNTIYAKNTRNEYVHARLLSDLKVASAKSRRKRRRTAGASGDGQRDRSAEVEFLAIGRQLVEQEGQIQQLEASLASLGHHLQRTQEETYVALVALNQLSGGGLPEVVRQLRELERKVGNASGVARLKVAGESLGAKCARLYRGP